MEVKKSPQADLENKKIMFLQIGFVMAIAIVLIAFDWSSNNADANILKSPSETTENVVLPPITRTAEVLPPPPPAPKIVDVINMIADDIPVETDFDLTTEATADMSVDLTKYAETVEEDVDNAPIFIRVEQMPEFPGGEEALKRYLASSVIYPAIAAQNNIKGRVYVSFVVNTKGEVVDVSIARGVHPALDKEALRVIQSMPLWSPGMQRDKKVKVAFTVPINFVLK